MDRLKSLCGCLYAETMFGVDLDHLFAYSTIKYVRILDRRLGLLKLFFTSVIISYILIFQIWYSGGYLQPVRVNGYSRFTLQQPTKNGCDPRKLGCLNDFTDRHDLAYCLESPLDYPGTKLPCRYQDALGVQTVLSDSIGIGTRAVERDQELVCKDDAPNCPLIYSQPPDGRRYYIADVDRFTLLLDHGVLTALPRLAGEGRQMDGRIYVDSGSAAAYLCSNNPNATTMQWGGPVASGAPCYVKPNKTADGFDIIDVGVLLQAANAHLDDISHSNRTYRETGVTLMIEIRYKNFFGWWLRQASYMYKVSVVKGSEWKTHNAHYQAYPDTRTVVSLSGVHVTTLHMGSLYGQSFTSFLIQLTTSLTLLAICNTIIDLLALFVMPDREEYRKAKYETTEDFSDLRKAKSSQALQLQEEELEGIRVTTNGEAAAFFYDCCDEESPAGGEGRRRAATGNEASAANSAQ